MDADRQFLIYLEPEGEGGGDLRVTNRHGTEVQRKHIVDQSGALPVKADLTEVVHGQLGPDGELATLIVFDFKDSNSRRIKEAIITITFADGQGSYEEGPDVLKIAPEGSTQYQITSKHIELKHSGNASASAGAGPASLSAGYSLERSTSQDVQDQITVIGYCQMKDRTAGGMNSIRWVLKENKSQKTGVPTHLRGLALLKRPDDDRFIATVTIKTTSDLWTTLEKLTGRIDKDDPLIFDPQEQAQPRKLSWAVEEHVDSSSLNEFDIEAHQLVVISKKP